MRLDVPRFIGIFPAITFPGFVRCTVEDGPRNGFMSIGTHTDEGVMSPFVKLEVVSANMSDEELVHLKCCYNNKYLRKASEVPSDVFVAATAESPNPDTSKWNSTIFRLDFVHQNVNDPSRSRYSFRLLYSGREWSIVDTTVDNLKWFGIDTSRPGAPRNVFQFTDLDRLVPLPRFVAFKGDNGKYLSIETVVNKHRYATFTATETTNNLATQFEVMTERDGGIFIRSLMFSDNDTFLITDTSQQNVFIASTNRNNLGKVVPHRLGSDGGGKYIPVALWHSSWNSYCGRSDRVIPNSLNAAMGASIGAEAEFQVEELIRSREMFNPRFMFRDSKIYEPSPITIVSKDIINRSLVSTQGGELSFSYTEFESSEWQTTHSWQLGATYNSSISARLPVLRFIRAEVNIALEAGYQGEHVVGKKEETITKLNSKFIVSVPPMTRSKVGMVVSRAKMQVPYSYTQRDTLLDWTVVTTRKFDGLYEGETTHVDFEVEEEKNEE